MNSKHQNSIITALLQRGTTAAINRQHPDQGNPVVVLGEEATTAGNVAEGGACSSSPIQSQNTQASEELDLPHNRLRRSHVCEAWQSSMSCLKERISFLYNNDTLSDVTFIVGRGCVKIPAHKFVLAIGSPVFDAMFNGPLALKESETTVELPDVEPDAFFALLKV